MTQLVELIKSIAIKAVEDTKPVQLVYGTVASVSPLSVKVSQKMILPSSVLTAAENAMPPTESPWVVGDILILLQARGGQQYLILGRKGVL